MEINIPDHIIDQLRCAQCKAHLSCGPIHILPDSTNICGRCAVLDNSVAYRNTLLENLLIDCTFPCMFEAHGCTKRCRFNLGAEHELSCIYRSVSCPSNAVTTCNWKGPLINIPDHFSTDHRHLIKPNATVKIKPSSNAMGLVVVKHSRELTLLIKYFYCKQQRDLTYDIRCFQALSNSSENSYTIEIKNCGKDAYCGSTVNLREKKCIAYAENFLSTENMNKLYLNKFTEMQTCTWYIEVRFIVMSSCKIMEQLTVATDALETLRCQRCHYYLIPPLYCDNINRLICKNCSFTVNCCRCTQTNMEQYLMETVFPCRWRGCEHAVKGGAIRNHELQCKHRMYNCLDSLCQTIKGRCKMIDHLCDEHRYSYCAGSLTFTVSFANVKACGNVFTIFSNEFVSIHYYHQWWKQKIVFTRQHSCSNSTWLTVELHFEHNHCKCTSRAFVITGSVIISFSELPMCFQTHEDLMVVVKLSVDTCS